MNAWQKIFAQSRVNDGIYLGENLPAQNWQWPQGTWLQRRLRYLRQASSHTGNPGDVRTRSGQLQ